MMGWTVFGYFLKRYLVTIGQVLGIIILIAYLVDFTEFARRAGGWPDYTFEKGLYLSAMRMPFIAMLIWPFVALIAGLVTLMGLNRRYELVVLRGAGVSAWQFLQPICLGALLVGVVAVAVVNPLASRSLEAVRDIEFAFRGYVQTSDELTIPWLVETSPEGSTIIGAARTARRGLLLGDATFLRIDADGVPIERYDARTAVLEQGAWQLENVRRTAAGTDTELLETASIPSTLDADFIEHRLADPEVIPVFELPANMEKARRMGLPTNRFAMHYHSLLALPALMVAMTLIAAAASLRFARMGQSAAMVAGGVLSGFLLYVAIITFTAFGNVGFMPPWLAAWTPVAVASFLGVTFLLHREDG
jgi:lipopolysaccharide export system permease protein